MADSRPLTPEEEIALVVEMATANAATDPGLVDDGRALAFAAVDEYRRAHAALELALADYDALDVGLAIEAMGRVRCHVGLGDLMMQEAGALVVFGRSDERLRGVE